MCGIAGFAGATVHASGQTRAVHDALLQRMCDAIRHRGPDDAGMRVAEGAALGMRRLSIIDLATGHQPLANEDGTVWVVFNGEIYNYRDLKSELEGYGHRFATASDTETIVHAYEQWGQDAIGHLRGMFGLAIWDERRRRLLLARDRVGIKPLYYAQHGDRLLFGSELKSLLADPDVPRALDADALSHYLSFLYTPIDRSIFRDICKLPPGHLLTFQNGRARLDRYWSLPADESFQGTEAEATEELREVLRDSVRRHLMSDVPLGAFLSGGVDSSVIVALMSEASQARVKTFSIGFDEPAFDELEHARRVAARFDTEHHEFVVRPDAVGILDDLVTHFDEPFADASAIPTWYVSELARQHVTVVLSGDGGDELFGGYDRYLPHPRVAAFDQYAPRPVRSLAAAAASALPHGTRGRNFLRHVGRDRRGRYLDAVRFYGSDEKAAMLSPDVLAAGALGDPEARAEQRFERYSHLPWASQMMRFDAETYLPEDVLTKVDRMSMAHSIESRVPLLDHKVVEFAMSLPAVMKIRNGRRKHVLKEAAAGLLPPEVLDRRKQGFGVPLSVWFRGDLKEVFMDTLLGSSSRTRAYLQPPFVRRLVAEHTSGRRDHALRLWQLVVLECWLRRHEPVAVGNAVPQSGQFVPLSPANAAP